MKQQLTEALARIENEIALSSLIADENDATATFLGDLQVAVPAARLVERLLPGECENCEGTGTHAFIGAFTNETGESVFHPCSRCHGSGRVWDEGIVEAVAKAVKTEGGLHNHRIDRTMSGMDWPDSFYEDIARAVLSALVELLTEKVE